MSEIPLPIRLQGVPASPYTRKMLAVLRYRRLPYRFIIGLLAEVARTHMPQLLGNARALVAGEKQFETEIDGRPWVQPSFPYQGKCLRWIREAFTALSTPDQAAARGMLEPAGLLPLIEAPVDR